MKKLLALALTLCLVLGLAPGAAAAGTEAEDAADALYALGLFRGTGTDAEGRAHLELGRALTRSEAVTMLVRLLGREDEAPGRQLGDAVHRCGGLGGALCGPRV